MSESTMKTMDEMCREVGPARAALLAAKAQQIADAENRSPGVDQGGQYVWASAENELYLLLCKETGNG